jgi:cytosolic phospholipase A2
MKRTNSIVFLLIMLNAPVLATDLFRYATKIMQSPAQKIKQNQSTSVTSFKTKIDGVHNQMMEQLRAVKDRGGKIDTTTKKKIESLKETQNKILKNAQETLSTGEYTALKTTVAKQQSLLDELLANWEALSSFWQKYALSFFKDQINSDNPYKDKQAGVKQSDKLPDDEVTFVKKRRESVKKGLEKFFNKQNIAPFTIGYVAPGGGYRAMILTSGYLVALEDLGILDAVTYISALSGSTWFLTPWVFYKGTVREYQQTLIDKIKKNMFNPATTIFSTADYISPDYLYALVSEVWPKFVFNQELSSIDVYGSLIANIVFGKNQNRYHLTDQWDFVKDGKKPFPMYTSVCTYNKNNTQVYNWNEFNALEITNLDLNLSIPAYSFGSEFDQGKAKEIAPQQSLGYLMGTFGSAYLVDLLDIKKICISLKKESENQGPDLAAEYLIAATILNLVNVLPLWINEFRVLPSLTNNPYKNASFDAISDDLKKDDTLMFVDGGIAYNIPGRPLLRKGRNTKVMIIGDTSGNNPGPNETPDELNKFFKDAQRVFNYSYKRVDDKTTETLRLYKDSDHAEAPLIIYFNFVYDKELIKKSQSDPELKKIIDRGNLTKFDFNCISNLSRYCGFLYFGYTENEFNQLSALAEFVIKANKKTVEKFLQDELKVH